MIFLLKKEKKKKKKKKKKKHAKGMAPCVKRLAWVLTSIRVNYNQIKNVNQPTNNSIPTIGLSMCVWLLATFLFLSLSFL